MTKKRNYLTLLLKGCCMGAADVVPGVSGGTIAFITGIYEELIDSIKSIDWEALKLLLRLQGHAFWKKINGNFLISVLAGIGISIFSLAQLMTYLLARHPIGIWSFFFGLIIASSLLVSKEIRKWDSFTVIALLAGIAAAYTITVLSPASAPHTGWFILLAGAVAICAMILPGISGAFILLLMGQYAYLMAAVSRPDLKVIGIFALGAGIGIVAFSHLLSWLLKNYRSLTIALLTGFMVGSLNKVWPWKITLETYTDRHGIQRVLTEKNVGPGSFEGDPLLGQAILMCLLGFFLIWGIEWAGKKKNTAGKSGIKKH